MIVCVFVMNVIGEVFCMIKYGLVDMMVIGGIEVIVCEIGIVGFVVLNVLNIIEDVIWVLIFFDKEWKGFVMGEGVGMLVLEEFEYV